MFSHFRTDAVRGMAWMPIKNRKSVQLHDQSEETLLAAHTSRVWGLPAVSGTQHRSSGPPGEGHLWASEFLSGVEAAYLPEAEIHPPSVRAVPTAQTLKCGENMLLRSYGE